MERCVECIEEVARLAPEGGPLAAYRILPQVLEYVRSMRDPFYLSLQSGELRGITLVELQASRIIELHEAMKNIIAMEETEMQYGRGGRQSKLDKALAERGMRRAPEAPYIAGDCVFDSISYRLHMIGLPVTSEGVREGAMRQLHHDYVCEWAGRGFLLCHPVRRREWVYVIRALHRLHEKACEQEP